MKRLALALLLVAGFVAGIAAFTPLETALAASLAKQQDVKWTRAEGTVLGGRVSGIALRGEDFGDAEVSLKPASLLAGRLMYAVDWASDHGRGAGEVSAGLANSYSVRRFDLDLDLLTLEQTALWIQQSGGRIQVKGDVIRFRGGTCVEATGAAQSDVLERNREILGAGWSDMRGELRCEAGDLVIPLESENGSGTRFLAQLRLAPGKPGRFEARVSGLIPRELDFALPVAGFTREGRDYVYAHSSSRSGPT